MDVPDLFQITGKLWNEFLRNWLKITLIGIGLVGLTIAALIGDSVVNLWYENSYKSQVQSLEIPDRNIQFVLLTNYCRVW